MRIGHELLYLSRADVDALGLTPADVEGAVEAAFAALAAGTAENVPKTGIDPTPTTFFHAMPAGIGAPGCEEAAGEEVGGEGAGVAGVKWVGVADNHAHGLPHVSAVLVLSDMARAQPLAIMDADRITGLRPAAVSMVAARRLARADSRRIGFVAAGLQARAHLDAFRAHFPLEAVTVASRSAASAEAFAAHARSLGLAARAVSDPNEAVAGQDIVVTSVPRARDLRRVLDPDRLAPGAFVSATDLARSWIGERIGRFDIVAADDTAQTRQQMAHGLVPWRDRIDTDLAALVGGRHPGRTDAAQRIMFVHPGMALGDVATAALVFRRARERGIGTILPR